MTWKQALRFTDGPTDTYSLLNDSHRITILAIIDEYRAQMAALHRDLDTWFERPANPSPDRQAYGFTVPGQHRRLFFSGSATGKTCAGQDN